MIEIPTSADNTIREPSGDQSPQHPPAEGVRSTSRESSSCTRNRLELPVRSLVKRIAVVPSPTQLTSKVTSLEPPLETETLLGFSPARVQLEARSERRRLTSPTGMPARVSLALGPIGWSVAPSRLTV